MFASIKLNIALFYLITTGAYIWLYEYLSDTLQLPLLFIMIILGGIVTLSAYMVARLATHPLIEYIEHLKALSSQTLHELNLPIATIQTNISLLEKNAHDPKTQKRLKRIKTATRMLQQRYDELDHFIKTQTMSEEITTFAVCPFLQKRIEFLKNIYPSHTIKLQCSDATIQTDAIGLAKVIDNLVQNSVKYSQKGSKITIKFENGTLSVTDEGEGIAEVELVRIFDNFYQGDPLKKGFGIGLYLVKRFCDTHNITLHIDSKPKYGTTVKLKF